MKNVISKLLAQFKKPVVRIVSISVLAVLLVIAIISIVGVVGTGSVLGVFTGKYAKTPGSSSSESSLLSFSDNSLSSATSSSNSSSAVSSSSASSSSNAPSVSGSSASVSPQPANTAPSPSGQPSLSDNTIQVSNADELFKAIKSGATIKLLPGAYDMDNARTGSYPNVCFDNESVGGGAVIQNVSNLKLIADNVGVSFITSNANDNVLSFKNCSGITVSNVTMGHTVAPGTCFATVMYLDGCSFAAFDKCDLYGSGTSGFYIINSHDMAVTDSTIRDCSQNAANIYSSQNVSFTNTTVKNNCQSQYYPSALFTCNRVSNIILTNCNIHDNGYGLAPYYPQMFGPSVPILNNCTFSTNYYGDANTYH